MKYFFDTEFIEGPQDKTIAGIKYGQTKPTIDLISIGMVSESGREYYTVSKDFNLKEAWSRVQITKAPTEEGVFTQCKIYWIRENVLKPIFEEWIKEDSHWTNKDVTLGNWNFSYKNFKYFLDKYGKTNKQIAKEIKKFVFQTGSPLENPSSIEWKDRNPEFYAYYADYDWVVFCQIFGTMIDLPKGFPMYCKDLKQLMDYKVQEKYINNPLKPVHTFDYGIKWLKGNSNYPKQENEHNALDDARWNKRLYEFLIKL